jgi:hypothetical protein
MNSQYIGPCPSDDDVLDPRRIAGAMDECDVSACVCDEPTPPVRLWSCGGCAATLAMDDGSTDVYAESR